MAAAKPKKPNAREPAATKPTPDTPPPADGAPSRVDAAAVLKAARLARIAVAPDEVPALAAGLDRILAFVERLSEVDVSGVEPMTSVTPMRLKRRADVVTDGGDAARVLSDAPESAEGFFVVPKIVE